MGGLDDSRACMSAANTWIGEVSVWRVDGGEGRGGEGRGSVRWGSGRCWWREDRCWCRGAGVKGEEVDGVFPGGGRALGFKNLALHTETLFSHCPPFPSPSRPQVPTVVDSEMEALACILGAEGQQGCRKGTTRLLLNAPIDGLLPSGGGGAQDMGDIGVGGGGCSRRGPRHVTGIKAWDGEVWGSVGMGCRPNTCSQAVIPRWFSRLITTSTRFHTSHTISSPPPHIFRPARGAPVPTWPVPLRASAEAGVPPARPAAPATGQYRRYVHPPRLPRCCGADGCGLAALPGAVWGAAGLCVVCVWGGGAAWQLGEGARVGRIHHTGRGDEAQWEERGLEQGGEGMRQKPFSSLQALPPPSEAPPTLTADVFPSGVAA